MTQRFSLPPFLLPAQVYLFNLAETNPTVVNNKPVATHVKLTNNACFVVGDRKFRVQYSAFLQFAPLPSPCADPLPLSPPHIQRTLGNDSTSGRQERGKRPLRARACVNVSDSATVCVRVCHHPQNSENDVKIVDAAPVKAAAAAESGKVRHVLYVLHDFV